MIALRLLLANILRTELTRWRRPMREANITL